jgi:hypothetical protein
MECCYACRISITLSYVIRIQNNFENDVSLSTKKLKGHLMYTQFLLCVYYTFMLSMPLWTKNLLNSRWVYVLEVYCLIMAVLTKKLARWGFTPQLEGPCSSPDAKLESGNELCVYRLLITAYLVSWAPTLWYPECSYPTATIMCGDWRIQHGVQCRYIQTFL